MWRARHICVQVCCTLPSDARPRVMSVCVALLVLAVACGASFSVPRGATPPLQPRRFCRVCVSVSECVCVCVCAELRAARRSGDCVSGVWIIVGCVLAL
jgi:hypothetical protein